MSPMKKVCLPMIVLLFCISFPSFAIDSPSLTNAFKNANIINIEVKVYAPEKQLVSSIEGLENNLKNNIYVELKTKLPSSIKVYKELNFEQEIKNLLQENASLDESGQWNEKDEDLIFKMLEMVTQLGHINVTVFVSESRYGGYYGVITLDFYRRCSLTTSFVSNESFSFDASVYKDMTILTGGNELDKQIKETVNDLVVAFIARFYEARPDL